MARHIPHAKEKISVVHEERIEEIAADFGCGIHHASDLDIAALGEKTAPQRNHAGLQLARDLEFPAHLFEGELRALRFQPRLVAAAHALGQRGEQIARYARYRAEAAPKQHARQAQHARLRQRDDKRRSRLAVDRGHFPDAFPGSNRNSSVGKQRTVEVRGHLSGQQYVDGVVRVAGSQQYCTGGQGADLAIPDRVDDGGRLGAAKQGDRVDSRSVLVAQLEEPVERCGRHAASVQLTVIVRWLRPSAAAVARDRPRSCESTVGRGPRAWLPRGLPVSALAREERWTGQRPSLRPRPIAPPCRRPGSCVRRIAVGQGDASAVGPPCVITFASASSRQ